MSLLNLNNMKIVDQFFDPYPLIIYSNLLDADQLKELQSSLSHNNTIFDKTGMGNRKSILKGTKNFKKPIE